MAAVFLIAVAVAAVAVLVLLAVAVATAAAGFAIGGLLVTCVTLIAWNVRRSKKRLAPDSPRRR